MIAARPRIGRWLVMVTLAVTVLGCVAPTASPTSPASPDTRVVTIDGTAWRVSSAGAEGMRGRLDFGAADGMLFDMGAEVEPGSVAFVMDGVAIPLDIAWFAVDGRLIGTAQMAPCAAEPCPRYIAPGPFRWAIEAPPGAFGAHPPGARLEIAP